MLKSMIIEPLPIAGAFRIVIEPHFDERGFFARRFDAEAFATHGLMTSFAQASVSYNARRGTLRGLHFQRDPHAETKIVRCTQGAAFDVIVDIRRGSPSYGQWHAEELSANNRVSLYLPAGTAHGFQTLVDGTELSYEITPGYVPEAAAGIRWDDPVLDIAWPIKEHIIGQRDLALPLLDASFI